MIRPNTRPLLILFATLGASLAGQAANAQVCRTNADTSNAYIGLVRSDVHDTTDLSEISLISVPDTAVVLVTNDSTCTVALGAYNSVRKSTWGTANPQSIYVVRVGSTRYVMIDPLSNNGHFVISAVFDNNWQYLNAYGG